LYHEIAERRDEKPSEQTQRVAETLRVFRDDASGEAGDGDE
jgi:hypothetical protein